ncbi:hypothetical protein MWU58_02100 [Flavobacteriaceae bacterium S0825]|uniref:hypothetical protein n=1 Tax=Gaetbulibacter sp. S0825 TaxID=2720084 RepID=UPI00142FF7A7|nr:hypothetical protein [Gaetbulibacter sp. S0825]MCK0108077.1 hypothetical protein [Flavobacteriaceae bacterium S0825]NIX63713.1 hypothetical protein [Gaetbulibacter sp. S0825]
MKKKLKISEYFIQLILVVLGVFLGILASEWNAAKNLENNQKEVLKNIKTEIESNLEIVKSAQQNRTKFNKSLDSLYPLLTEDILKENLFDRNFYERFPNWRGIGDGQVSNAMFEMAKFSNMLSSMDIDIVSQLSKTYAVQDALNKTRDTFLKKFFDFDSDAKYADALRLMWSIRQELGSYENKLVNEYSKTLEMLR